MQAEEIDRIVADLPKGRTLFHYFRQRYAFLLLEMAIGTGTKVCDLKSSSYAPLLRKPAVRQVLSRLGTDVLRPFDLQACWPEPTFAYRLSLGRWPARGQRWERNWHQMARRGQNLVLQLNLSMSHVRRLEQVLDEKRELLQGAFHPVAGGKEFTLAWARLDIDRQRGEALVEEIQSDWIGEALSYRQCAEQDETYRPWMQYVDRLLAPHTKMWDEAMLASAIWFLNFEVGIRRIFYYTFETGNRVKHLSETLPPRSLYTDLPRRFCFRRTHNGPQFLRDVRDRTLRKEFVKPETTWFRLDVGQLPRNEIRACSG